MLEGCLSACWETHAVKPQLARPLSAVLLQVTAKAGLPCAATARTPAA